VTDLDARPTGGARVVCFGELMLRLSPPHGGLLELMRELEVHVAGAEANVAVALTRLGHTALMVSVVPDNDLGRLCVGELRRHGVITEAIRTGPGRLGLYFVQNGAGYRPTEVLYDRADSAFALNAGNNLFWDELLDGADWLHLSGITAALGPQAAESVVTAAHAARSRGVRVSFDCNYRSSLWSTWDGDAGAILRTVAELADLLFASERDLALILERPSAELTGTAREEFSAAALAALARFEQLRFVATTARTERTPEEHELAAMCMCRDGFFTTRVYTLSRIVQRIGSGDAFAAGMLHALSWGFDPQRAIDFAAAAACLKHSFPGDFSLATVDDIEALLRGETSLRR
jgi:2-dehydro-3-deoxygluconokinase